MWRFRHVLRSQIAFWKWKVEDSKTLTLIPGVWVERKARGSQASFQLIVCCAECNSSPFQTIFKGLPQRLPQSNSPTFLADLGRFHRCSSLVHKQSGARSSQKDLAV